jgi:hypothetical protein
MRKAFGRNFTSGPVLRNKPVRHGMRSVNWVSLIVSGLYYHIGKRAAGIRYIYTGKPSQQRPRYCDLHGMYLMSEKIIESVAFFLLSILTLYVIPIKMVLSFSFQASRV